MRAWFVRSIAVTLLTGAGSGAPADVIRLTHGGEIRGTLRAGHTRDPQVTIETLSGGVVVLDRKEVQFTSVRRLEFEQYELKARETPNTAAAHWELAEWCRENNLRTQRDEQLEQVVLLEPDNAVAHKALGHVQERGAWMTREEQMASRGYILHKGKYVTPQELELIAKSDAERTAEREWYQKMVVWVRWLGGNNDRQRQQGVAALKAINDPAAVWGLTSHMADHRQPDVRRFFVEILAGIPGDRSVAPLVQRSLYDVDAAIRLAALNSLRPEQYSAAAAEIVPALRNSENEIVNRAGDALGTLNDVRTVPALIDALVTQHSCQIQVPTQNAVTVVQGPNGYQFSDPNLVSQYLPLGVDIALRTGQLPWGVQVIPPNGSNVTWRTYQINAQIENPEVLASLQKLTGQNFGYDERTWKLWWAAEGQKVLAART
jgi:hypothetical protein